jgi:hypothetical protein
VKRLSAGAALACAALAAAACERTEPGAGSSTNWLRPCADDGACGEESSCRCGVCTRSCDAACSGLAEAVCVAPGSAPARTQCGTEPERGLCLPRCSATADCAAGQLCTDGACVELAPPAPETSGCGAGASLEVVGASSLQARYGAAFSDALYLPVEYAERPTDWSEPSPPATLTARVTGPAGQPIEGCTVRFVTGAGSGVAFAEAGATDASGELFAYWVAGDSRRQKLSAALVRDDGTVTTQELSGLAYANDEGPQSDAEERADTARPTTLRLYYDLPQEVARVRVTVSPNTFPHHGFYAPIALPGFFTGLQNTSDIDAESGAVPDDERTLIASVWNLAEGDAEQLFGAPGLVCAAHDQDLGGIRCLLPDAWSLGDSYVFELERRTLAPGESAPEYGELGYSTEPCASAAGCTDYTVFFGATADVDELQRVVAYRYQSAEVATSTSSFVQAYAPLPGQNSCLATPTYDVTFLPSFAVQGTFQLVTNADFSADYAGWQNQVCANYAASAAPSGYRLVTGGTTLLGRPLLSEETARRLALP